MLKLDFNKLLLLAANQCWSIPDLCAEAGITPGAIYRSRANGKPMRSKTLGKLAKALGVEPRELLLQE